MCVGPPGPDSYRVVEVLQVANIYVEWNLCSTGATLSIDCDKKEFNHGIIKYYL